MAKLIWIAAGGAIGSVLRYAMVTGAHRVLGPNFPWGTLTVNVLGSLLIGLLWAVAERTPLTPGMAAFLFIGVLGAFTTFSTFSLETMDLYREGEYLAAGLNVLVSNALCLLAAFGGLRLGGYLTA
ncbi:MAG: fluoride efflux transporter CrcB [Rhodothermales bacterium]|nr:fluoride efflux transporter CrcB [Rhodothermales bacterium]